MKASQAISREVDLDGLVKTLIKIAVETAGAQRGYLLLLKEGKLCLDASSTSDTGERRYRPSVPVETAGDLPLSIVHYVTRTRGTPDDRRRRGGLAVLRRCRRAAHPVSVGTLRPNHQPR